MMDDSRGKVRELARHKKYDEALKLGEELVEKMPDDPEIYAGIAHVYELKNDFRSAILEISKAIAIEPEEADYYFNRARWCFESGDFRGCIEDSSSVVEIELSRGRGYYSGVACLMRALAKVRVGDVDGAVLDSKNIPDGTGLWLHGKLYGKEDVLAGVHK